MAWDTVAVALAPAHRLRYQAAPPFEVNMLKFERRQITTQVMEGVTPYVQAFAARYGGVPAGYWEDEYVLGFVPAIAGLFATVMTRGKIGEADRLAIVGDCMQGLSGGMGEQIMQQLNGLMLTQPKDFVKAAHAAGKVVAFSMGQCPADDPDLVQAQKTARQQRGGPALDAKTDFADTARALVHQVFYDVVNQRLMGNTDIPETDSSVPSAVDPGFSVKF
jgi:hypothetical protein